MAGAAGSRGGAELGRHRRLVAGLDDLDQLVGLDAEIGGGGLKAGAVGPDRRQGGGLGAGVAAGWEHGGNLATPVGDLLRPDGQGSQLEPAVERLLDFAGIVAGPLETSLPRG